MRFKFAISICFAVSATQLCAQFLGDDIPKAISSSVTSIEINDVASELATYCSNSDERISVRVEKLENLGFKPAKAYKGFEAPAFFVRNDPPRLVIVQEGQYYERDPRKAVWMTTCGIMAGGQLSEAGMRGLLSSFGLDPNRSRHRQSMDVDVDEVPKAVGWLIPPSDGERFVISGWTGEVDGQIISSLIIANISK